MNKFFSLIILGLTLSSCENQNNNSKKITGFNADSLKREELRYTIIKDSLQTNAITDGNQQHWTPSQKQIRTILSVARATILKSENKYTKHLKANSLNAYYKQLICFVDDKNDSLVYINGICRVWDIPNMDATGQVKFYRFDWHNRKFRVKDGGDCFWGMLINYSKKKSIYLSVNGEA